MAYSVMDVAKYVLYKCASSGRPISNLQLQKILYYVQKAFLDQGKVCFEEDFEAWQFGPVIPTVYYEYCVYSSLPIHENDGSAESFFESDRSIIDGIVAEKCRKNPWDLVRETHEPGRAWHRIYRDGMGMKEKISRSDIENYG